MFDNDNLKNMIPELWSLKIREEIQHRTVNIDIH